jgi:hypothetical protein
VALPQEATQGAVALQGTAAYVAATDSLQAVDTSSGQVVATIRPRQQPLQSRDEVQIMGQVIQVNSAGGPPQVATVDGKTLVLAPFLVQIPGHGTTQGRSAMELTAVAAATNQVAWTMPLELPEWASDPYADDLGAAVVGVQATTAVVVVANSDHRVTYAVDLAARQVRWQQDRFAAAELGGGVVIGTVTGDADFRQQLAALAIADGRRRWAALDSSGMNAYSAGPKLVAVSGQDYLSGDGFFMLLDRASGATVTHVKTDRTVRVSCAYDGAAVTVCSSSIAQWVFAVDTAGKDLWELPDRAARRVAPTVTAVWHGAVYATTGNGPVVLDARTGADRNVDPGIAPVLVDDYVGLARDGTDRRLTAYPATG